MAHGGAGHSFGTSTLPGDKNTVTGFSPNLISRQHLERLSLE